MKVVLWAPGGGGSGDDTDTTSAAWRALIEEVFDPGGASMVAVQTVGSSREAWRAIAGPDTVAAIVPACVLLATGAASHAGAFTMSESAPFEVLAQSGMPQDRAVRVRRTGAGAHPWSGPGTSLEARRIVAADAWAPASGFWQLGAEIRSATAPPFHCEEVGTAEDALNYVDAGLADEAFVSEAEYGRIVDRFPAAGLRLTATSVALPSSALGNAVAVNRRLVSDLTRREHWQRRILSSASARRLSLVPSSGAVYVSTRRAMAHVREHLSEAGHADEGSGAP